MATATNSAGPVYRAWMRRHLAVGATVGVLVAVLGRSALLDPDLGLGWAFALWAMGVGTTVLVAVALAALLGACTGILVQRYGLAARATRVATGLAGLAYGAAVSLYFLTVATRLETGAYPTVIAWDMFVASPSQFLHAGLVGNTPFVVAAAFLLALVSAAVYRVLLWPEGKALHPRVSRVGQVLPLAGALFGAVGLAAPLAPSNGTLGFLLRTETAEWIWAESLRAPADGEVTLAAVPSGALSREEQEDRWLAEAKASQGPRPNVLLIMLESVAPDHLGYGGYARPVSPRIDALAGQGLRYVNAFAASSQSNYSQMSILSSLLPIRRRRLDRYDRLDYPRFLFHDLAGTLGYQTATISSQNEQWQGMKEFQTTGRAEHLFFHSLDHPGPHIGSGGERKLADHLTVERIKQWWSKQVSGDRPWALYVNFQRTHFPYVLPPHRRGPWQPSTPKGRFSYLRYDLTEREVVVNRYDNALRYVDEQVGVLLDEVRARGELDNTIVILVSDHGERFGDGGEVTHGKGLTATEMRVPVVISWLGHLEPQQIDAPVSLLDLMPTIAALLEVPPHPSWQGQSVLPGEGSAGGASHPAIFARLQGLKFNDAIVCWPYKLVYDYTRRRQRMFNLELDPGERNDLMQREAAIARRLLLSLKRQRGQQVAWHRAPNADPRGVRAYAPRLARCPCPESYASGPPPGLDSTDLLTLIHYR